MRVDGQITVQRDPIAALELATKQYVDDNSGGGGGGGGVEPNGIYVTRMNSNMSSTSGNRAITFDTLWFSQGGYENNLGTGEITLPETGWYNVHAHVDYGSATGVKQLQLRINDDAVLAGEQNSVSSEGMFLAGIFQAEEGDVAQLRFYTQNNVRVDAGAQPFRTCLIISRYL